MDGAVNLKQQKKPVLPRMKKYAGFYVLFLPVLAFLVVFHYLPMFGIYYSFTKYTIIKDPVWVGLANFERLFAMPNFWNAFQNHAGTERGQAASDDDFFRSTVPAAQ